MMGVNLTGDWLAPLRKSEHEQESPFLFKISKGERGLNSLSSWLHRKEVIIRY